MLLVNSTEDFTIDGIPYPNLPILVNEEMAVVVPVLKFIVYQSIQNGRVASKRTVKNYAAALYDFFSFLEANDLKWDMPVDRSDGRVSVIALYRNWSASLMGEAALKRSTINTRLAAIQQFYQFCYRRDLISEVPWEGVLKDRLQGSDSFLRHTRTKASIESTDLKLKTFKEPPKVLNLEQIKLLLSAITNKTLLLMVKLALTTGLRREEIITFQRDLITKPSAAQLNTRLAVNLNPKPGGQQTKGNRSRTIYVPAPLMFELYEYLHWGEGVKRHSMSFGDDCSKFFVATTGKTYSETSINTLLSKLKSSGKVDFSVSPHMLRHTFATLELYAESQTKDMAYALAWVRDRLGHSSIQTTMIYIHCIEQLDNHEVHQYQQELMALV